MHRSKGAALIGIQCIWLVPLQGARTYQNYGHDAQESVGSTESCGHVESFGQMRFIYPERQMHGAEAYPFTPEKFAELAEIEKARETAQTLETVLVKGERDFLLGHGGKKVGKTVLLYFSAHRCPPCRAFLPKLIEAYHKIKSKDKSFKVVFVSSDKDQSSFEEFFARMPWLAVPYGDERKEFLSHKFKVRGIPMLVALGPWNLLTVHGADAYPFTEDHNKKKEEELEELVKGWPKTLRHPLDEEHELVPTRRRMFTCDGCQKDGQVWSYYCEEWDLDLHPECALKDEEEDSKEAGVKDGKEGWICDW